MKLLWNHRFGQMEQQSLVLCRPLCMPEAWYEEAELLDHGWLALDHPYKGREVFYQSRSTRVDLEKFEPRHKSHTYDGEKIQVTEVLPSSREDLMWTGLYDIYKKFLARKKFKDLYNPFKHLADRDSFLVFYIGDLDNVVGFTKIKKYVFTTDHEEFHEEGGFMRQLVGVESVLHASTIPISSMCADLEMMWSRERGSLYHYLGSGYEASSEYKSKYKGFEWWTGEQWSRSKKTYGKLCRRDSSITDIKDLRNAT